MFYYVANGENFNLYSLEVIKIESLVAIFLISGQSSNAYNYLYKLSYKIILYELRTFINMGLNNNDIFKKLRVALQLRDDEIVDILKLVDFRISRSELSAFFRKEGHPKYMECGDQILRNFLNGLVIHLRGPRENSKPVQKEKPVQKKKFVKK